MIVSVDQARIGIKKYIENEVAFKAHGLAKFLIYFAMPSIDKSITTYINQGKESPLFSDMFNSSGEILLDEVYSRATFAAEKSGKILIDKFGLALDRSDVEKIYQYIRES